ncbi:FAD synthase (RibF) (PDB:1MRZ) [Commensalibacter communis]|uniref:bifunctional riboflavin kinase/FAD synthetase n=1 Tax=Commensalibacter communis TaxID=2972786 RepID=UPI0022FF9700|nr:bifunctional riboflavin kinase/FAD synthetase [Commensalibacter communis]CAI3927680.1 FAD synthase (RibF) (PDB:1MRZ) [Commensalibacter communis]
MTVIFKNSQSISQGAKGSVAALGNFDGVHRGHGYLIQSLREQYPNRPLSVVTFEPHPRQLFFKEAAPFRLTNADERNAVLKALGVNFIFQIDFTQKFASLSAYDFVHQILHDQLGVMHIACGNCFAFGKGRSGTIEYLASETQSLGIGLTVLEPLQDGDEVISSSRIRHLLREGHPRKAAELLGRVWSVRAIVQHGDKRGRTIGFPTANLFLGEHVEPMCGVYAVKIALPNGEMRDGVANVGYRPTFGQQNECRLEVHLFDFNQDIYGQELQVWLHHFIRSEKRFSGLDELKDQIAKDALDARDFFSNLEIIR